MLVSIEGHPELTWETSALCGPGRNATICLASLAYCLRPEEVAPVMLCFIRGTSNLSTAEIAKLAGTSDRLMRTRLAMARQFASNILQQKEKSPRRGVVLPGRPDLLTLLRTPDAEEVGDEKLEEEEQA